jgi:RNase H-like domain found in reverse transcriptase
MAKSRIGAVYGQSLEWQTCRPTGFLSKKFSVTQQHYRTHKYETIPMLKALMKWEDDLLGQKFTLVTVGITTCSIHSKTEFICRKRTRVNYPQ